MLVMHRMKEKKLIHKMYYEYIDQLKSLDQKVINNSFDLSNNAKQSINCNYSNESIY